MAAIRAVALVAGIVVAVPAQAQTLDRFAPIIAEASQRCGVPADWIARVIRAESAGQTMLAGRPITSRAGAMGLMQLMPATWGQMRARLGLGPDPYDPQDNILAGSCYLRLLHDRFGYPGLFAAYSAGPARYAAYLSGAASLPGETRAYLIKVAGDPPGHLEVAAIDTAAPVITDAAPPLFMVRHPSVEPVLGGDPTMETPPRPGSLFAIPPAAD